MPHRDKFPLEQVQCAMAPLPSSSEPGHAETPRQSHVGAEKAQPKRECDRLSNELAQRDLFLMAMANDIPGLLGYWDADLRCVFANKGYCDWFGRTQQEIQGITLREVIGEIGYKNRAPFALAALCGEFQSFEGQLVTAQGETLSLWLQYIPRYIKGVVVGFFAVETDITTVKQGQERLRIHNAALQAVSQGVMISDVDFKIISVNTAFSTITGFSESEVLGRECCFLEGPLTDPLQMGVMQSSVRQGQEFSGCFRHYRKDGTVFWNELSVSPVCTPEGTLTHLVAIIRDVTERLQAEEALRIAATGFESQEAMLITDAKGVILRVNRAFSDISGYSAQELVGKTPALLKSGRHGPDFYATMWASIHQTGCWQGEVWDRRKNGEIYPKWLTITAVKAKSGEVTHYVGAHTDITWRKEAEKAIQNLAFYDPLTQLPNRRLLDDRLNQALTASKRGGCFGAVMFLDLDNFKPLNDQHGHIVGDLLLVEVARRLCKAVRESDTVARFGGDEFVVVVSDLAADLGSALPVVERLADKIRFDLSLPYLLATRQSDGSGSPIEHLCTVSLGAALFAHPDRDPDDLLKKADAAMYQAKQAGRNLVCVHGRALAALAPRSL